MYPAHLYFAPNKLVDVKSINMLVTHKNCYYYHFIKIIIQAQFSDVKL